MARTVSTFLMFEGTAEAALQFYASLFPNAEVVAITRYTEREQGKAGTIKRADFRLAGHDLIFFDSPVHHQFTFTPAVSLFVECDSEVELDRIFLELQTDGSVLMPAANYGFSTRFGWVNDRFGVSWQLNLR